MKYGIEIGSIKWVQKQRIELRKERRSLYTKINQSRCGYSIKKFNDRKLRLDLMIELYESFLEGHDLR